MRRSFLIFVFIATVFCDKPPAIHEKEFKDVLGKTVDSKQMFALSAADAAILNEINTMRKMIADGEFDNIFSGILRFGWDGLKALADLAAGGVMEVATAVAKLGRDFYELGEQAIAWAGNILVDTVGILEVALNEGKKLVDKAGAMIDSIGSFFGKRKRKKRWEFNVNIFQKAYEDVKGFFSNPKNVFGPAANMNLLTWNRRLAQLAMVEKDKIEADPNYRTIEYEGKKYRINKYGTLATYIVNTLLGENIGRMFNNVRTGYLAIKLWMRKDSFEIPTTKESTLYDETHEMLFADRWEVGCFFTFPNTLCIIGPLNTTVGYLYQAGNPCDGCKYGCRSSLCNPSPDYFNALREKYKKHLRPKIEKFEIVEGFDGKPPPIGYNFMLDSANHSNVLMVSIIMAAVYLYHSVASF